MLALRRTAVALGALLAIAIVGGAVLAYLAFGRTPGTPAASPGPVASVIARSAASPDAPEAFRVRPTFVSCGQIELAPSATIPPTRIACLSATPDEGRELVVVSETTEGDPIVRYFRTGPDVTGVEIFEDATRDRFGSGVWQHTDCRSGQIDQTGACA